MNIIREWFDRHFSNRQVVILAVVLALGSQALPGEAYIIAEHQAYTLKEAVDILEAACGKSGLPLVIPSLLFRLIASFSEGIFKLIGKTPMLTREKAAELLASWEVSTSKARDHFGFESEIPFEQGAKETLQWYYDQGWLK